MSEELEKYVEIELDLDVITFEKLKQLSKKLDLSLEDTVIFILEEELL